MSRESLPRTVSSLANKYARSLADELSMNKLTIKDERISDIVEIVELWMLRLIVDVDRFEVSDLDD